MDLEKMAPAQKRHGKKNMMFTKRLHRGKQNDRKIRGVRC